MSSVRRSLLPALLPALMAVGGCASALDVGRNTALDGMDLEAMTGQMAASLAADRDVREAIAREGPMPIVIEPVQNHMTAEILPPGQAEGFVARLRALLDQGAPADYVWVINRDDFYRLRNRELNDAPLGPVPDAVNPRYRLWGKFYSITDEDGSRRSSAYLCAFELTDLERRVTLWRDSYQVRKVATKGFLD